MRPRRFGAFEVDPETRQLRRQGERIRLQEQPFQVLWMLLERAGSVVTREELRQALWPGSVYVDFDHGLNNAIARLREALGDNAVTPSYIETLPRLGYRFIHPVEAPPEAPANEQAAAPPRRRLAPWLLAGAMLIVAIAVWLGLKNRLETPDAGTAVQVASVAVVPFSNLSADAEDGYFADGLSEQLMTQLSQIRALRVAGVASSFRFKGGEATTVEIAGALNVDHLLEGSVRRSGDRVRITARLVEARTDRQLWSETFEREFADIFAIEDEIARAVTAALQVRVIDAEARRLAAHGTHDAEAYRLYLMGMAQMRARGVRPDRHAALRQFERAIAIDPEFASAHAGIASYYFNNVNSNFASAEDSLRNGLAAAKRAYALDPEDTDATRVMGDFEMLRYRFLGDSAAYARAIALFQRAIETQPGNSYAHFDFGRAVQWSEPRRACELFERADDLDPLVPVAAGLAVLAMQRLGEQDAASQRLRDFVARAGDSYSSRVLGAFESYAGRLDTAAAALINTTAPFTLEIGPILLLAGIQRSFDDRAAAEQALNSAGNDPLTDALRRAAIANIAGDHKAAFEGLDRDRQAFAGTRMLDVPTARLALLAGKPERAAAILEQHLPDLARGSEEIVAIRVLPALDLVLARLQTGQAASARALLQRLEVFLDGPNAPRLPMFTVLRARAHALAGRTARALETLERARAEGFRQTCHLDLHPQPFFYVDCLEMDPAFAAMRDAGTFQRWLASIHDGNRALHEALRSRQAQHASS